MRKCYFLRLLFVLCIALNSSLLLGQKKTEPKDSLATYSYRQLSDKFYASKSDSIKAIAYAKAFIGKAQLNRDTLILGYGYSLLTIFTKDSSYVLNYWKELSKQEFNNKNKIFPAYSFLSLGDYYFQRSQYNDALKNYLLAEKSINKNDSLRYLIIYRIGVIKKKYGNNKEAINLLKNTYNYLTLSKNYNDDYYSTTLQLSQAYKNIKKYDSAIFFKNKVKEKSLKLKDSAIYAYALYIEGEIDYKLKNYRKSIEVLNISLPFLIKDYNYTTVSDVYKLKGLSNLYLNNKLLAISNFVKIDSIKEVFNFYHESQKPAYKHLIDYYRDKKNNAKELEYINKYLKVDSALSARAIKVNKNLTDNYDIPKLLEERKVLLGKLEHKLSNSKQWLIGLGTGSLFLIFILVSQARKKKMYQQRFLELLNKEKDSQNHMEESAIQYETNLPEDVVADILTRLELFENKQDFLSNKITLPNLAKTFHTNSNYLSKVINHHKKQSYSNYINKLRINYAVERLKTDMVFRKYTLKAIGEEIGFKNTDSFTNAFYKFTGIKASYFITELDNH